MADDKVPHLRFGDERVPYVQTEEMTFDELRLVKQLTGLPLAQIDNFLGDGDPDAWFAVALVALQRVRADATGADVGKHKLMQVIAEIVADDEDEERQDPPAAAADDAAFSAGSEEPSSETTLDASGAPPSSTGTDSDRGSSDA